MAARENKMYQVLFFLLSFQRKNKSLIADKDLINGSSENDLLYLSLVRSNLAYCSQVWAPQADNLILDIERIQRRATKFILSLPYRSHGSYKQRLLKIGLLQLCYWHEFLDLVYVFKCLVSLFNPFIPVMNSTKPKRTVSSKGTLLNTIRANTVTFENSFYCRAPRIWNTLSAHLRNTDCSLAHFKNNLFI